MKRTVGMPRPANPEDTVAIDLEIFKQGDRLHRPSGMFACATFCFGDETYMITDKADLPEALERVDPASWVFQNATYDLKHLRRWADVPARQVWDTMLVEQDLFGGYYNMFGLDSLARRWLEERLEKDMYEEFAGRESMTQEMIDYSFKDAEITHRIAHMQADHIESEGVSMRHYWEIDEPMIWVVLDMKGAMVNKEGWRKAVTEFGEEAERIEDELGINTKSPKQCRELLAEVTGDDSWLDESTAKEVLRDIVENSENPDAVRAASLIREGRQYRDMSGARYGEEWLDKYVEEDGRVYSLWKIARALTGRMASADPNLQNIPVRNFPIYRTFFVAPPGYLLGVSDVGQQEPRITAHLSQDERLLRLLNQGVNPHQAAANGMSELIGREIDYDTGKAINLGVTYGETKWGLARNLAISKSKAQRFLDAYFQQFPGVDQWIDRMRKEAWHQGYVETVSGRRSWINPHNTRWENNAINSPVQGSAADHTKLAAAYNWRLCRDLGLPFGLTMIIHDEQVQEFPAGLRDQYEYISDRAWKEAWSDLIPDVPVEIDSGVGRNWYDGKENADE